MKFIMFLTIKNLPILLGRFIVNYLFEEFDELLANMLIGITTLGLFFTFTLLSFPIKITPPFFMQNISLNNYSILKYIFQDFFITLEI